ncbi:MAG: ATP-binding cassette domain-containing protein [Rhabdochlamydiaceae bacterium]|nr:ATP-binding cassette domain-containing protein [Rhabdochlamydiaceae bacterium]
MSTVIHVCKLSKHFQSRETAPGVWGSLKGLFCAQKRKIDAVKEISFSVKEAEKVAFIGPNGAGKSTTIKMLTGILYPTSGSIEVMGIVPWKNRRALGFEIGVVFGQRTQLWYHLPPSDTFKLLSKIYEIDPVQYQKRFEELTELFELAPFLNKPVRQLSLGERMRCEIVASLLPRPKILFLDEPTIGLDVNAKLLIRKLLNRLTTDYKTTLFLTSHDTADIEQICDRVIVIDKGEVIADTSLRELKKTYCKKKLLTLITEHESINLDCPGIKVLENTRFHFKCEVDIQKTTMNRVVDEAFKITNLKDITIEDMSMDEVIQIIYSER